MNDTWIVVAEAARARIFDPGEPNDRWTLVQEFSHRESRENNYHLRGNRPDQIQHPEERDVKGDNPERLYQVEDERFAKEICDSLQRAFSNNAFRELVLVAPPRFLGRLRSHLSPTLKRVVKLELDKDYTQLRPDQLAENVPNI